MSSSSMFVLLLKVVLKSSNVTFSDTSTTYTIGGILMSLKAPLPIVVTEFGIVIDVKAAASENAQEPIVVTELGIVIDVKF